MFGFEGTQRYFQEMHPVREAFRKVFLDSSMVEHTAVNRGVVGSSPTRGVQFLRQEKRQENKVTQEQRKTRKQADGRQAPYT